MSDYDIAEFEDIENEEKQSVWDISDKSTEAYSKANEMNALKHGLYASIPIRCKAEDCPYADVCPVQKDGLTTRGEHCVIEASTVENLAQKYMEEYEVTQEDITDMGMIRNLVNLDISIFRCEKKLAIDADIVQQVVIGLTEDGREIRQPQINLAYDLQDRLINRRQKTLSLLNGTRKDKAKTNQAEKLDPSQLISDMKNKLDAFENDNVIDVTETKDVDETEEDSEETSEKKE